MTATTLPGPSVAKTSDKTLLARVTLAWPTLALTAVALGGWGVSVVMGVSGGVTAGIAIPLAAVFAFIAFTPLHDASHHAVGKANGINAVIGRLSAIPLLAPFLAFRYVHLEHHKHTNESDGSDPDFWSGSGPRWALPLRWLTQDLHYYYLYARVLRSRPRAEVVEVLLTLLATYGTVIALMASGYATEMALFVLLPARIAVGILACTFDYLPHVPYAATRAEDRYKATRIIEHRWLTPLMLSQNYHLVHHLYPAVPWYRYGKVWWSRRDALLAKGAVADRPFGG